MRKYLTICPYCGCGCGMYLEAKENDVLGVNPSYHHPISRGKLCVKGWNVHEFINSSDRLTYPLIRKNGSLKRTSWEEAIDYSAEKLLKIKKDYGSESLGILSSAKCTNEENFLLSKFTRIALGTNNIDHCARLCHASTVTGLKMAFGSGAMTNSINELENADCILVAGSNTTSQHPMIGARILNAVEKGAKLIVVDSRKIHLCNFATIHLCPKPGTDVAWINCLMQIMVSEKLADIEYIKRRTENFEETRRLFELYTPEYTEKITGIPKENLIKAARIYAGTRKAMIVYSMGITQHVHGTENVLALANLSLLAGHVGYPHSGVNPLRGQNNVQGACDMGALPDMLSGYQPIRNLENQIKFNKAWKTTIPSKTGLTVVEMINEAVLGNIKGMFIMGENPMISDPDINHVKKALENLDFLLVSDMFLTDTADLAHVVLPACSFAEKDGTFTNTERRVQRVRKTINTIGECLPDWQIICKLSNKMGHEMSYEHPREIMEEIALLTPIYGGIFYDRLDEGWGLQWPCYHRDHLGTSFLHQETFIRGKAHFTPVKQSPSYEETDKDYPFILTTGRIYFHFHTGTMSRRCSALDREVPEGFASINYNDAQDLDIKEGEKIKIISRRGEIEVRASISEAVCRGAIFVSFHFKESPANKLTSSALDPVSKIPELKVCACKVEKL
ncbi:MAG: formate dehydrogenase subunit alpha [bacterium]|nr:formate dehydrogenase subunit alpha [bacterium]